jgi:hypothetical protein
MRSHPWPPSRSRCNDSFFERYVLAREVTVLAREVTVLARKVTEPSRSCRRFGVPTWQ